MNDSSIIVVKLGGTEGVDFSAICQDAVDLLAAGKQLVCWCTADRPKPTLWARAWANRPNSSPPLPATPRATPTAKRWKFS